MNVGTNNATRTNHQLRTCATPEEVAISAADIFEEQSATAIARKGQFRVALSGGSTPKRTYQLLAHRASQIDWEHIHIFWGDERYVPADDPQSNFRMTAEALLDHVPIPATNVHRVRTELDSPETAARAYENDIRQSFGATSDIPRFDLAFLGLGSNGHTASLFPHSLLLEEHDRIVAADFIGEAKMWRITMTAPLLNAALMVVFLVAGPDKAEIVREVISGPRNVQRLPAQLIQPKSGDLLWILDESAAKLVR